METSAVPDVGPVSHTNGVLVAPTKGVVARAIEILAKIFSFILNREMWLEAAQQMTAAFVVSGAITVSKVAEKALSKFLLNRVGIGPVDPQPAQSPASVAYSRGYAPTTEYAGARYPSTPSQEVNSFPGLRF
jgi:hypothetical protein